MAEHILNTDKLNSQCGDVSAFYQTILIEVVNTNNLTKKDTVVKEERRLVEVPLFNNIEPAKVSLTAGITKNLGNYEAAKMSVTVTMPCLPNLEEVLRTYNEIKPLVSSLLEEEIDQ